MDKHFSIQEVSKRTGLSPSTIRYYEREGLIQTISRNPAGVRQFHEQEIEWINFLGKLKSMEMPISQMKLYARLRSEGNGTIQARVRILEQHKQRLLEKINALHMDIGLLDKKLEMYRHMEVKEDE